MAKAGDRRLRDLTIHPAPTPPFAPYRSGGGVSTIIDIGPTADGYGVRIHQCYWSDGGRLTDFVITVQIDLGASTGDWHDILKVDCCHQEVHVHRYGADEQIRQSIRPIELQQDLIRGAEDAEKLVWDNLDETLRRWTYG